MNKNGCPVCGFNEITVLDDFGCTIFEICDSCGCESGYSYDQYTSDEQLMNLRKEWVIVEKCNWWGDNKDKPSNWDPIEQMTSKGLDIPGHDI